MLSEAVRALLAEWLRDLSFFTVRFERELSEAQQGVLKRWMRTDSYKDFTLGPREGDVWELRVATEATSKRYFQNRFNFLRKEAELPIRKGAHGYITEQTLEEYVARGVSKDLLAKAKDAALTPAQRLRKQRTELECRALVAHIRRRMVLDTWHFCLEAWKKNRSDPLPKITRKRRAAKKLTEVWAKILERRLGRATDKLIAPARQARKAENLALARDYPERWGPNPKIICLPLDNPFRESRFSD